ncbi:MAG: type III-A CRISPR-associated protein Cas10/Csm1 [Candidatus Aenigmatarchaeota archaeon]
MVPIENNNFEREVIFLSALLHDIGKFVQRASENPKQNTHTGFAVEWLQQKGPVDILNKILGNEQTQEIITKVNCHHDGEEYISLADSISAGMDRINLNDEEEKDPLNSRLISIFSKIELIYEGSKEKYHKLAPLDLSKLEEVFPTDDPNCSSNEYKKLLDEFQKEIKNIDNLNLKRFIERVYYLLQKYTWCIPSAAYKCEPDVSLFDHLKTTSAIAICLYDYNKSQNKENKQFLLLCGDISGIQNFIYRITHTEGTPGVSKRLRGRSFYISLLAEVVSKKIISELDLYPSNIIFCSGGRFEILLPNTEKTRQKIREIDELTNKWLFNNFEGELGLIMEELAIDSSELKNYTECSKKLDDKISLSKKYKFKGLLFSKEGMFVFQLEEKFKNKRVKLCKSCNLTLITEEKEDKICDFCNLHKKIGELLPKLKVIIYAKNNISFKKDDYLLIDFDSLGKVYLVSDANILKDKINDDNIISIEFINDTNQDYGGFTFLGNIVPTAKDKFEVIVSHSSKKEKESYEQGDVLDFETIASLSIGDKRLGLLKMDVDYLGLIFSLGLEREIGDNKLNLKSISRIATLSRMLDLYFKSCINNLCNEIFQEWYKESNSEIKDKINQIFYITYSGGDDLLIIGPWSEIPKLALRIRNKFKEYTCDNKNINLSAGVFLIKPKFPIGKAALLCGEELEKSKNNGRNRITLFGETVEWDENNNEISFKELISLGENLYDTITAKEKDNKLARGFVHSLIRKRKQFIKENEIDLNYIPALIYQITRNIKEKARINLGTEEIKLKEYIYQKLITETKGQKTFRKITIPASYALLKSKKEG